MPIIHGYAKRGKQHHLYRVWYWMKSRCYNPNDTRFSGYGKRGISICEEWYDNPVAFIEWALKNGWKKGLVLDREDNNGNYCPENCRFVNLNISNANQGKRIDNTSGYRGINYHIRDHVWCARIQYEGKRIALGAYQSIIEAIQARNLYIKENGLPHPIAIFENGGTL